MNEVRRRVLPVWWSDLRDSPTNDPIGCPVTVEEIVEYLSPFLKVYSSRLEFIEKGEIEESAFWLWAFYADEGRRWNLCIFSGPSAFAKAKMSTWMCADNNADNLNDADYVTAIHNQEY